MAERRRMGSNPHFHACGVVTCSYRAWVTWPGWLFLIGGRAFPLLGVVLLWLKDSSALLPVSRGYSFTAEYSFTERVYHDLSIYSHVDRHLGWVQCLTVINKATLVNTPFCKTWVFISLELLHLSHGGLLHDFRLPPQVTWGLLVGWREEKTTRAKLFPSCFHQNCSSSVLQMKHLCKRAFVPPDIWRVPHDSWNTPQWIISNVLFSAKILEFFNSF